ncbi:unnamed protein product [Brassica napus]|uniref:(rape) hypothetical protein n=1 Tax=Brassica napus TaxID=3708 RepID=A0A816NMP1_BRANA|nr:unnamed protein product [Brassica napus]
MGLCYSRNTSSVKDDEIPVEQPSQTPRLASIPQSPVPSEVNSYASSPFQSPLPAGVAPSPARTPGRKFKWPFPPPSPAKPIMAALRRRRGAPPRPRDEPIPEDSEDVDGVGGERLDKNFGFGKNMEGKYEMGKEVGRGHFGHTCWAKAKKGKMKGQTVAVKIISKAKMTSALSIEDVRREVKLLKALSGHKHMVKFYDVYEDNDNVYVVMELCEGGELLDRILARGGKYPEVDAKRILVQILSATAFFHLQGVVHRDLKPENFLFTSRNEDAVLKVIDFGLSDFIRYDQRLNDVVGSAYYVAPEVLHRSYSTEADMWSIGVISYILLCGSRPFYGRTESAIFRCVLRANPNFEDMPWPSISPTGKDFVKRLLNKDHRKRMTAAQALAHPWLRDENPGLLLDFSVYKLVRSYIRASPFRRSALKALAKAIPDEELVFLKAQFMLLDPKDGGLSLNNFTTALTRYATDAMMESKLPDILNTMQPLVQKKLDFEEFCAAGVSVYQLEALEEWEQIATSAFEHFEQEGNRVISVQELAGILFSSLPTKLPPRSDPLSPKKLSCSSPFTASLSVSSIGRLTNSRRKLSEVKSMSTEKALVVCGSGKAEAVEAALKKTGDCEWTSPVLLFGFVGSGSGADASIGVNYGTLANNLPPPRQVAEFLLHSTVINRIRLFNADPQILQAFAHTGVAVTVTISNDQIPHLTNLSFAQRWISDHIQPHFPSTNIIRILVGNEVISTANHLLIRNLVPAMQSLHTALVSASLHRRIQISTPHSLGILSHTTPPSSARFRQGYDTHVLKPLLSFLRTIASPFVVNPYPFFGYSPETLDFALFRTNPGLFDQDTKLHYTNMFDAQLDSVYSAMERLGFSDVAIVVGEIGWPSKGDKDQIGVDVATAAEFNRKVMDRVNSGTGTPLMPNRTFETYIFALFNENLKPGPVSERNFGLFRSDLIPVYDIGILRPTVRASDPPENNRRSPVGGSSGKRWCVTKSGAETEALQRNIDYVCGLGLDCEPIIEGGPCFLPNTVEAHSAYAMNLFYQTMGRHEFDCDFDKTGEITSIDPSYGDCQYQAEFV